MKGYFCTFAYPAPYPEDTRSSRISQEVIFEPWSTSCIRQLQHCVQVSALAKPDVSAAATCIRQHCVQVRALAMSMHAQPLPVHPAILHAYTGRQ